MDEPKESERERKVESRAKKRRFQGGSRAYLHAMTNSRTRRNEEAQKKVEGRRPPEAKRGES